MAWASVPLNVTVLVPGVNVPPLLVQLPAILMVEAVPAVRLVPEPMVKLPFNVMVAVEPPIVRALVFDVTRLLKVCDAAVPFIDWEPVPLNVTVPVPGVNVPPLLVQLPPNVMLELLANIVPAEIVRVLLIVTLLVRESMPAPALVIPYPFPRSLMAPPTVRVLLFVVTVQPEPNVTTPVPRFKLLVPAKAKLPFHI